MSDFTVRFSVKAPRFYGLRSRLAMAMIRLCVRVMTLKVRIKTDETVQRYRGTIVPAQYNPAPGVRQTSPDPSGTPMAGRQGSLSETLQAPEKSSGLPPLKKPSCHKCHKSTWNPLETVQGRLCFPCYDEFTRNANPPRCDQCRHDSPGGLAEIAGRRLCGWCACAAGAK